MDLVTVTCFDDLNQMLLQSESIQKFVSPCTHWVIVNELEPRLDFWKNKLEPYYKNHKLNLISFSNEKHFLSYMRYGGYFSQQVFKILISKFIKGKYLIIDTKSIFVKPTCIDDYEHQTGNGQVTDYSNFENVNINERTIQMYAKKIGTSVNYLHLDCLCPFVMDAEVIKKVEFLDELLNWFIKWANPSFSNKGVRVYVNEYLLYSTIFQKYGSLEEQLLNKRIRSAYFWNNEKFSLVGTEQLDEFSLVGFHRRWINACSRDELKLANDWLNGFNFKNKLIRTEK